MAKKHENNYLNKLDNELVKRTIMVSAFPALIKSVNKEDGVFYEGLLPGFESTVSDIESEDECVEYLQDILDDEVENLVCLEESLPFVEDDDKLLKKYPNHKIVYLDINVYATQEELDYCDACAEHSCHCGYDCDDSDDDCHCGCCDDSDDCCSDHSHCSCDCGEDDCSCGGDCHCGSDHKENDCSKPNKKSDNKENSNTKKKSKK